MNMKKTIAAIAAGAMAVSAMASSVSAIELKDQVLSYNLVRTHKKNTEGVVTISGSISGVDLSAVGGTLKVKVATPDGMPVKSITVGGYYNGNPATPITNPYTRVNDKNADNYGSTVKDGYVDISVGTGSGWFSATANTTITVTVVYGHTEDNLKAINDNIAKFGIFAGKASDEPVYVAEGFYVDDGSDSDHNGNKKQDWDEPTEYWLANSKSVTTRDDDKKLYLTADTDVATIGTLRKDVVSSAFTAKGSTEYKIPFATYANGNQNIVYYLQNNPVRTADAGYTNVLPVINDAIANYGTVTFTFTTATQGIAYTVQNDKTGEKYFDKIYGGTTGNYGPDGTYAKAVENAGILSTDSNGWDYDAAKQGILAFYTSEWYGDTSYTSFTQHLYNGTNDVYAEQNGWAGFANGENFYGGLWGDNNLFGGALVINENLTMRLSDVDMFDYTETTLSFDWDAISADATNYNAYATYVQSIKLATSTTWYWDKMDITLADVMAADATGDLTVGEGDVANETPVDDTDDAGEEITDPADDIEEPADEPEEPADEPADEAPAEVAPNPTTGNAPVALAVIPVALAAAAVVAKKRG